MGVARTHVNWDYITTRVAVPWRLESRETGLVDVFTVSAGECLERTPTGDLHRSLLWDPQEVVSRNPIETVGEATRELRRSVRSAVHTWASCYSGIVHALSGGFDSSVVLSCLADAPSEPQITCQTYYSEGSDDERKYADLAARRANCRLIEMQWAEDIDLRGLREVTRAPTPTLYLQWLELSHRDAQLAHEVGADAIFGGHGGDQVFFQRRPELAVADHIRLKGFSTSTFQLAVRAAYAQDLSVWRVLRDAILYGALRRPWQPRHEAYQSRKLIRADVLDIVRRDHRFDHPCLTGSGRLPPAKIDQIYYLADPIEFYDPFCKAGYPERVFPLWSQLVIETCLRIPSYILTFDGRDRSIARRAFSEDIPLEISTRYAKGRLDHHIEQIFWNNLKFIREVILDGALIARGILDRHKAEQVLAAQPSTIGSSLLEIFDVLSIEIWLEGWTSHRNTPVTPVSDPVRI
jgi:asparagine synthase (glutamine-hydrolysing)